MSKCFKISTLGCKLNFSESSEISRNLIEAGYERAVKGQKSDVVIINTCTVTELANKKSKQTIRRLIKENPGAKVIAVGCYSQLKPGEVAKIEGVDLVLGSNNKFDIPLFLKNPEQYTSGQFQSQFDDNKFNPSYSYGDRTRSFFKVQDGCDYFCSYCTIPHARGRSRNNTIESTVAVARQIVQKGIKELILAGVNIGDFGKSTGETFFGLLQELVKIDGLLRIRISSIEPNLLTDQIIEFAAQSDKIVPHFHIPLQCGTDNLLRLMRRRYTTHLYRSRIEKIKSLMPDACIAADIIVGVPGETDEEFEKVCAFIRSVDVSYLHVFTYSERENTLAAKMDHQVSVEERKERSKIMHLIADQKQLNFHTKQLNSLHEVLFEADYNKKFMFGFTDNYIRVEVPLNLDLINQVATVKLLSLNSNGNVNAIIV